GRQYRKGLGALDDRGCLPLERIGRKHQDHRVRRPALCRIDRRTDLARLQRIDDQYLAAPGVGGQRLERGLDRISRPDRCLTGERLTELEQELVAGRDCSDVNGGLRTSRTRRRNGGINRRRSGRTARRSGFCTGHLKRLPPYFAPKTISI